LTTAARLGALALPACLLAASGLHAQAPVSPGERVRFRAGFAKGRQHGTVVQGGAGALTIQPENGGAPVEVPLDAFEHLEVARGKRRHFWTGAGIGLVPGLALGFYAGWGISCDEQGVPCRAGPALAAGGVLGAGTALAGGLVGLLFESDRWERVSAGRVRVSVAPAPNRGVTLGVSFRF
jgi:hypothetical protein